MTELAKTTTHKLTAAQVESDCAERLQQIGKEITERLAKADKQTKLADNHVIAVNLLIAEAKELCDGGGYDKFRELYCPQLSKSQAYALLAIADVRKSLSQHRADERDRKQRSRANLKNSGTVPEKPEPQGAPTDADKVEAPGTLPEQKPKPAASARAAPTAEDTGLRDFTYHVARLVQMTKGANPDRYIGMGIKSDALIKLGKFLSEISTLKSNPPLVPQKALELSAEQSAEDMKAKHMASETTHDLAA